MQGETEATGARVQNVRPFFALLMGRLRAASCWPTARHWAEALVVSAAYLLLALPLALRWGLIDPAHRPEATVLVAILPRVLFLPALVEELLFRVLPNPHPYEHAALREVFAAGSLSLVAYVLAHPLAGYVAGVSTPFMRPEFLLLAALLGSACLLLYRRSGSLLPPVALHWLVVSGWLAFGGEGLLPAG